MYVNRGVMDDKVFGGNSRPYCTLTASRPVQPEENILKPDYLVNPFSFLNRFGLNNRELQETDKKFVNPNFFKKNNPSLHSSCQNWNKRSGICTPKISSVIFDNFIRNTPHSDVSNSPVDTTSQIEKPSPIDRNKSEDKPCKSDKQKPMCRDMQPTRKDRKSKKNKSKKSKPKFQKQSKRESDRNTCTSMTSKKTKRDKTWHKNSDEMLDFNLTPSEESIPSCSESTPPICINIIPPRCKMFEVFCITPPKSARKIPVRRRLPSECESEDSFIVFDDACVKDNEDSFIVFDDACVNDNEDSFIVFKDSSTNDTEDCTEDSDSESDRDEVDCASTRRDIATSPSQKVRYATAEVLPMAQWPPSGRVSLEDNTRDLGRFKIQILSAETPQKSAKNSPIRCRFPSECESEDSFIVFNDTCASDIEDCTEESDRDEADFINNRGNVTTSPSKKVRFASEKDLCKVHKMVQWPFAYHAARRGPWEEYARDRERFKQRILTVEKKLKNILQPKHRDRIYHERFVQVVN